MKRPMIVVDGFPFRYRHAELIKLSSESPYSNRESFAIPTAVYELRLIRMNGLEIVRRTQNVTRAKRKSGREISILNDTYDPEIWDTAFTIGGKAEQIPKSSKPRLFGGPAERGVDLADFYNRLLNHLNNKED